jgi:hypothetical protein
MLGSAPNRDFPPDQQGPEIAPWMVACDSFEHARDLCLAFIREHDLGGGNWIGGRIHDDNGAGKLVARVSYNGRIWLPDGGEYNASPAAQTLSPDQVLHKLRETGERREPVVGDVLRFWRSTTHGRSGILGHARLYSRGWKFMPNVAGRHRSRKFHPTLKRCLPRWVRYPDGCESAYVAVEQK